MTNLDLTFKRFPETTPFDQHIPDDPVFDPARHLQLGQPANLLRLDELGYTDDVIATIPTSVAASSCFQLLSQEGVETMYHVCKQLEAFTTSNPRIARNTRGGSYRSGFLRDFSLSPDVTQHISTILQAELLPHAMGHQLSHLNYQPLTVGEDVDKWHYDTLQVDYVMFVTDPNAVEGGEFQYFLGTRDEMKTLHERGEALPADRVIAPDIPGAGYAVLMQGNYVVHQAKGLKEPGERITLVNGYSYADSSVADYTAFKQLLHADSVECATAEYVRHVALRCAGNLRTCINQPDFSADRKEQLESLRAARLELDRGIKQLEDESEEALMHFGN